MTLAPLENAGSLTERLAALACEVVAEDLPRALRGEPGFVAALTRARKEKGQLFSHIEHHSLNDQAAITPPSPSGGPASLG